VIDSSFLNYHKGKYARKVVRKASRVFEKWFGIKLVIVSASIVKVNYTRVLSSSGLRPISDDVRYLSHKLKAPKGGIVIWLTSRDYTWYGSVNVIHGRYAVVTNRLGFFKSKQLSRILVHEIAHLFGAQHVNEEGSLMCPYVNPDAFMTFSEVTTETIRENKWTAFKSKTYKMRVYASK
jgi:hypothetical protein